jgi:hypothetical protein
MIPRHTYHQNTITARLGQFSPRPIDVMNDLHYLEIFLPVPQSILFIILFDDVHKDLP